jgi:hypothetical protein
VIYASLIDSRFEEALFHVLQYHSILQLRVPNAAAFGRFAGLLVMKSKGKHELVHKAVSAGLKDRALPELAEIDL